MEEQYIKFETAKLAKEKGFDIVTMKYFNSEEDLIIPKEHEIEYYPYQPVNHNKQQYNWSRPTQALLQRWLREVHNIIVIIDTNMMYTDLDISYTYFVSNYTKNSWNNLWGELALRTYEETLEVGLQKGLELIDIK